MTVTARQQQCRDKLISLGYSIAGASALTGNFVQESGKDLPSAFRTGKLDHGSQALPQWRLARLTSYENWVQDKHPEVLKPGMTIAQADAALWPWFGNMDLQLEYVDVELKKDYPQLYQQLRYPGIDVSALAADVCWQYERPSKELSGIANRIAAAVALANDATSNASAGTKAFDTKPTVVEHLLTASTEHDKQATGGVVAAGAAGLGALGLFGSNFLDTVPKWELVVVVVLLAIAAMCIVAALAARKKAHDVKAAVPQVVNVPKPLEPPDVKRTQVTASPAKVDAQDPAVSRSILDDPDVRAAIAAAIAADRANREGTKAVGLAINGVGDTGTIKDPVMNEVVKQLPEDPVQIGAGGAKMTVVSKDGAQQ